MHGRIANYDCRYMDPVHTKVYAVVHHPDLCVKQFRRTAYASVPMTLPGPAGTANVVVTYLCPHLARMACISGMIGWAVEGDGAVGVKEHGLKEMAYISTVCLRLTLVVVIVAWCDLQSREVHHTIAYTSVEYIDRGDESP